MITSLNNNKANRGSEIVPVVEDSKLIGCVTTRQVKEIPRQEWNQRKVGDITEQCSSENTISPETDAVKALSTMSRTGNSRLMVVDNGRLIGVIALKDMRQIKDLHLHFLIRIGITLD